jgi:hypothetical protein
MVPSFAPDLRSLTVGEIFDRATTMYVRNFSVFTLIVLTLLAPSAILRYLVLGNNTAGTLKQVIDAMEQPNLPHPGLASAAPAAAGVFIILLITLFLAPFVNNAVAVGVAMLYHGETPHYALAFRRVLARGWALLGTILLCFLLLVGIYLAFVLFLVFAAALGAAIFGVAGIAGFVVVILGAIVMIAAMVLAVLACVFALYATTLEGENAGRAIPQAFGRIFNRREFGKAVLMTLAYLALELIAVMVTGGISYFVESVLRSTALDLTFATIAGAMLNAYVTTLLAVYYFDVRTRIEGLDLEVDIARLSPS